MAQRVALIFGAGPNIGQSVAKAFIAKGYKVAIASRTFKAAGPEGDEVRIQTDCADTDAVKMAFKKVDDVWGPPHVVVYNGVLHALGCVSRH
jgi:NAD(P)-dependent dehydrogenase (short-subunit alcohol dehydrogenase family)